MLDDLLGGLLRSRGSRYRDEDPESRKARIGCVLLFCGGLLLLMAVWQGQKDLRLRIWGQPARAKVERVLQSSSVGGRALSFLRVVYDFRDRGGRPCTGYDDVGLDFPARAGDEIDVFYLEGSSGCSMIAGQGEWAYLVYGLVGLALAGVPLAVLLKGAFPAKREERR